MSDRLLLIAFVLAYMAAGAVLGFACIVLINAADQINNAPFCRRI